MFLYSLLHPTLATLVLSLNLLMVGDEGEEGRVKVKVAVEVGVVTISSRCLLSRFSHLMVMMRNLCGGGGNGRIRLVLEGWHTGGQEHAQGYS